MDNSNLSDNLQLVSSSLSFFRNEYKSTSGFNLLPQHILLKIFAHLEEEDLNTVQQVCQGWKECALNPVLWKKIKIEKLRTTAAVNMALQKIWMFDKLERVYIKDVIESSALLRQVFRCLPNLQYLIIRYCNNLSSHTVRAVLRRCKQLKMLDLKGTTFKDGSVFDELASLDNLQILNLSENGNITTKELIDISLNCQKIEELYVSSIGPNAIDATLTDEDCSFIVSNLAKNLRGFSIDGATLTDQCFQNILLCPNLKHLGLHRAYNLNGKTFSVIWKYLTDLKTLKFTFGNQIRNEDVETLFSDGKTEMKNLEVIDFTGCWKIGDSALEAIAECCVNLKKLILKNCKNITDISCLKKCKKLAVLNIAFCSKLSLETWLPAQSSVNTLFIEKGENLRKVGKSLEKKSGGMRIKICHSQFRKSFEEYKISSG